MDPFRAIHAAVDFLQEAEDNAFAGRAWEVDFKKAMTILRQLELRSQKPQSPAGHSSNL